MPFFLKEGDIKTIAIPSLIRNPVTRNLSVKTLAQW